MAKQKERSVAAIDLFCGAGGLTHGFVEEGIPVKAGYDVDPKCKFPYEQNNQGARFVLSDVEKLSALELEEYFDDTEIRILAGCAPCQPFSTFRHAYQKNKYTNLSSHDGGAVDKKWGLLNSFGMLAATIEPEIITMENVAQLCRHSVYDDFVSTLEKKGYHVSKTIVDCSKYGIPQKRKRLVLFASKLGKIEFTEASECASYENTVSSAIRGLPQIAAGEESKDDPLHKSRTLSELNLKRITSSKPQGTWEDWDEELLPPCYRRVSGKTFKSVYGRMSWTAPAPVITTQFHNYGTGRFGHPDQDRALSLREGALLQTFPKDYEFVEAGKPVQFTPIARLIGNAVPPTLARLIAKSILRHLDEHHEKK